MYVEIDSLLRSIIFPEEMTVLGVKGDKNVHKLLFKMPVQYDSCDNLIDFNYYVDYVGPNNNPFRYDIDDQEITELVVGEDEDGNEITEEFITFSWLMDEEVFATAGIGKISVCLQIKDSDDAILQEFHTALTPLPEVLDGIEEILKEPEENLIIIDNNLRTVTIPSSMKILGVEGDSSVHRLYFRMPSTITGLSLFEDTIIYINYKNPNGTRDRSIITDAELSEDGNYIYFSWLVGRTAFEVAGIVQFVVCIQKVDAESIPDVIIEQDPNVTITNEFNTMITALPPVVDGLEITDFTSSPYYDVITSYLAILEYLMDAYKTIKESIDRGLFETYPISRRYYGECYTDTSTGEKLVEITDNTFTYQNGIYLDVWFENDNSEDDFTLGIIIRNEDGSTSTPDNPDDDEPGGDGIDDECNDPEGAPWESEDFVLLLDLEPVIEETESNYKVQTIDDDNDDDTPSVGEDEDDVVYLPVYYICTDEHDIHRVKAYRWESKSFVTFRYFDGLWVMEQSFATNYESQANGLYSNSFAHHGQTELYGNTIIGEYNILSVEEYDDDDAMDDEHPSENDPNVRNDNQYVFQIGNGTSEDDLSDAFDVTWSGDTTIAGGLTVGGDIVWNTLEYTPNSLNNIVELINQEANTSVHYDSDPDEGDTGLPVGSTSIPVYIDDDGYVQACDYNFEDFATKDYVAEQIEQSDHLKFRAVDELPDTSEASENTVYAVPNERDDDGNVTGRTEYILVNGSWEIWGTTDIKIVDYENRLAALEELVAKFINANTYGEIANKSLLYFDDVEDSETP